MLDIKIIILQTHELNVLDCVNGASLVSLAFLAGGTTHFKAMSQ